MDQDQRNSILNKTHYEIFKECKYPETTRGLKGAVAGKSTFQPHYVGCRNCLRTIMDGFGR